MTVDTLLDRFDVTYEQPSRLELAPIGQTPESLRDEIRRSLVAPWRDLVAADDVQTGERWFWVVCDDALQNPRAKGRSPARVLLHEIAGHLRVTNVTSPMGGPAVDMRDYNRLVARFRDEVAAPLERQDRLAVRETGPAGSLSELIGEPASEALARFSLAANKSSGNTHPGDNERWNRFLVEALPVSDGTGFAEALQSVLERNGWSESAAYDLAIQAERANDVLAMKRQMYG